MSVLARIRVISNERLDIPDIKNIESFACADWAQFFDKYMANTSFIVKGFDITSPKTLIGADTNNGISLNIADSVMFHPTSANAGGGFYVAPTDEAAQSASLAAGTTNYIELDQQRVSGSADIRKIWSPSLNNNEGREFDQIIDTVEYLEVLVYSNTVGFTEGRIPIAKIVTSAAPASIITSITDCRPLFFRLGTGGATPNPLNDFAWVDTPSGFARVDSPLTVDAASPAGTNPFKGSDKNIRHFRDWMEAVMTRIKELGSTPYWFTKSGLINNAAMGELWWDSVGSKITGTGDYKHTKPAADPVFEWTTDIVVKSILGNYEFTIPANTIILNDDEVAYLVQERNVDLTGGIDLTWVNGVNYVNGSAGAFTGLVVGDWIKKVSDGIEKYVQITDFHAALGGGGAGGQPPATALSVAVATNYAGTSTSEKGVYAKGTYTLSKALRNAIPNDSNVWWLAMNMKNGGGTDYFYIRGGIQLVQDEDIPIGNETSVDTIDYIGAADDADATPDYDSYSEATGAKTGTQSYNSTNDENLTKRSSLLTTMMADKAQDKNVSISGGGNLTWTLGAPNQLAFTSDITVAIGSSANLNTIQVAQSPQTIPAGSCVYFTINRNAAANLTLTVDTLVNVPLDENTFILAYHDANDSHLYLMDGTRLVDSEVNHLGGIDFFAVDAAFVTVVDDITYPAMDGDFKLTSYANASLCIQAAVDSTKAEGGTIYIRTGTYDLVTAINFEGTTKALKVIGDGNSTELQMPNIVQVSEAFVSDGDIGGAGTGTLDVANPTSLSVGDWVVVTDDNSSPISGWVTNINVGGGAGGSDRITVSEDSAGATPINTMAIYTVAQNADITTYDGAVFILPWEVNNVIIDRFKITNPHNLTYPVIIGNKNEDIRISKINTNVSNDIRNRTAWFIGTSDTNRMESVDIFDCNIGVATEIEAGVKFEGFFRNIKVHNNRIRINAGGYGVCFTDSNDSSNVQGRYISVKNNNIDVRHNAAVAFSWGVKVEGYFRQITIADNIIDMQSSSGGGIMYGIEFWTGAISGTAVSIDSRSVIANNQIYVITNTQSGDRCISINGDMTGGAHFDHLNIVGNICKTDAVNPDYCVSFRGMAFAIVSDNVFNGGNTYSEYWHTTPAGSQYVVAGPNSCSLEPGYQGLDQTYCYGVNSQLVKAWGHLDIQSAGVVDTGIESVWNISSASWSGVNLTINWDRDFRSSESYGMSAIVEQGLDSSLWAGTCIRNGTHTAGSVQLQYYVQTAFDEFNGALSWSSLVHVDVIAGGRNEPSV